MLCLLKFRQTKNCLRKIGDDTNDAFISTLQKYAEVTVIADSNLDSLQVKLKPFTTVIIGYHKSDVAFKRMIYDQMNCLKLIFLPKQYCILDVLLNRIRYCLSLI
jgi:hypothetical protein